jgi:hypothetical protein
VAYFALSLCVSLNRVHASAGVPTTAGGDSHDEMEFETCKHMQRTEYTDSFLSEYIRSETYSGYVILHEMDDPDIRALARALKNGEPVPDNVSVYSAEIAEGDEVEWESYVGSTIPEYDFIATSAAFDLETVWNRLMHTEPLDFPTSVSSWIDLELYYISEGTSLRSMCQSNVCSAWRNLVTQLHYTIYTGLRNSEWSDFDTFLLEIAEIFQPLIDTGRVMSPGEPDVPADQAIAPLVMIGVAVAAEVGCWCTHQCFRYYRRHYMTTSTTTVSPTTTTPKPDTNPLHGTSSQDRQFQIRFNRFLDESNEELDRMLSMIGGLVTETGTDGAGPPPLREQLLEITPRAITSVMHILSGIVGYGPLIGIDVNESVALVSRISAALTSARISDLRGWKVNIVDLIARLRAQLDIMEFHQ